MSAVPEARQGANFGSREQVRSKKIDGVYQPNDEAASVKLRRN